KETKIVYKRDLNITTKIEPTVTTPSRKVILELLEYSTTNYGTNEVQKQIIDQGLKQAEEIEEFIKNKHKEVIVKEVIDSLVQNEENPMMKSFRPDSRSLKESLNEANPKKKTSIAQYGPPREKFRAIIKNLPKDALESSMLRQFKNINAKIVHIPENSNRNQCRRAFIYFESEADLSLAL
ncbi:42379_t:CDS:2, partial [Gigaspora margarita]